MVIGQLFNFQIAESKTFIKTKHKIDKKTYEKLLNLVYPQLRINPFYGVNIKKLKGELAKYYRFRLGNYKFFYLINNNQRIVIALALKHRQFAYKLDT